MSASRSICSRCSSQLRAAAVPRLAAAARFTTRADSPQTQAPAQANESELQRSFGAAGQTPFTAGDQTKTNQDSALALFNDVVSPAANTSTGGDLSSQPIMSELEVLARIGELSQRQVEHHKEFSIFRKEIWPHVAEMPRIPKSVYEAVNEVLGRVRSRVAWVNDCQPISLEVAQMYSLLGRDRLDLRNDLVVNLCFHLTIRRYDAARRKRLVDDLIGLWQHISQLRRKSEEGQELRFALPTVKDVLDDLDKIPELNSETPPSADVVKRALVSIFLQFEPQHAQALLPGLLTTLAVLSDKDIAIEPSRTQAAPLLHLLQQVMLKVKGGLTQEVVDSILQRRNSSVFRKQQKIRNYVVKQHPYIMKLLLYQSDHWQDGVDTKMAPEAAKLVGPSQFHSQLRVAYRLRNTGGIYSIWQNLKATMESHPRLRDEVRDDPHFLDFWVFVWCAVRRSNMLHETIDMMQSLDIQPTVKTYTSMMHGWKIVKDTTKIEALWEQLAQSEFQLDNVIWTERISALIDGGRSEEGIAALYEMVMLWKQAAQQDRQSSAVEPTIAVVNAVVKGLFRQNDPGKALEVLDWAGREGFVPDVRTFNILLRESLKDDTSGGPQQLLTSMKEQGVEPDSATFTILLEAVLGRMGPDVSVSEQLQAIDDVFSELKSSGVKPGLETYAKMLYAVSTLSNGSEEAIEAVQQHMRREGFTTSPYMVTILIERALNQHPPNITRVRQLLHEHKLDDIAKGDQTLWERVMSAFAVGGQKDEAMALFDKLTDAGRPVTSLPCLTDLLKMLLEHRDLATGQRVVKLVLENQLRRNEEFNERYWRHHFWHLAKENGLLAGLSLPNGL